MDTRQYWYGIDGERLGPVSLTEIHRLVQEGRLRPTDYIWNEDHRVWTRVTDFLGEIGERGAEAGRRYGGAFVDESPAFDHAAQPREYAGFWLRLGAYIIDSFVLGAAGLVWFVIAMMLGLMDHFMALESSLEPLDFSGYWEALPWSFWLGGFLISWIYEAGFLSSRWMATPGKKLMGIIVVDANGGRCGFGQASLRTVMKIIFAQMTGGLAYLVIAFTQKKQGIHDLIAQTFCEKL